MSTLGVMAGSGTGDTFFRTHAKCKCKPLGKRLLGLPQCSSGKDPVFSLPWARVQFLVREPRSHKPHGVAKKKKKLLKNFKTVIAEP